MNKALTSLLTIFCCLLAFGITQVYVWMIDRKIDTIKIENQDLRIHIGSLQSEYENLITADRILKEATERPSLKMKNLGDEQQVEVYTFEIEE